MNNSLKPETLCVQGGWQPKKGEPRVLPIYSTVSSRFYISNYRIGSNDSELTFINLIVIVSFKTHRHVRYI